MKISKTFSISGDSEINYNHVALKRGSNNVILYRNKKT